MQPLLQRLAGPDLLTSRLERFEMTFILRFSPRGPSVSFWISFIQSRSNTIVVDELEVPIRHVSGATDWTSRTDVSVWKDQIEV